MDIHKKRPAPRLVSSGRTLDFYDIKSGKNTYSVKHHKSLDEYNCTCIHGSNGFKGLCWHIKTVQELIGKRRKWNEELRKHKMKELMNYGKEESE